MTAANLTRVARFCAAHRYFRPDWTAERNDKEFGKCANEKGHGHNYRCLVTVGGQLSADTSMIIGLEQFDEILREEVIEKFDHRHLNEDVPEFAYGKSIPTAEALAVYIWDRIAARLPEGVELQRIRVEENPDLYADYHGKD